MASSPKFKVYNAAGEYQAACKEAVIAAAVVALLGDGATIRSGHASKHTVWTEGPPADGHAAESYDRVREVIDVRLAEPRDLMPQAVEPVEEAEA